MFPLNKGKTTRQARVGLPEGTFEQEHGRRGFVGKSAHLYHANAPTGWIRFEGKLRPHCFDLNKLEPTDQESPRGSGIEFLGNDDIRLSVSRRSEPMPFYFRNADGDELLVVHRGEGTIKTDFRPREFTKGDYVVLPWAVTCRIIPRTRDNFFLVLESAAEFNQPERGLLGQHALSDPGMIVTPEPKPLLDHRREWKDYRKSWAPR
jgi:homogentisate 1,2-dioxygenase